MSKEAPQFKPDEPTEQIERQEDIAQDGVKEDAEFFLVTVTLKTGKKVTECLPKNFPRIALDKEGKKTVNIYDAIKAVQKFYPEMAEPNFKEAVRRLYEPRPKK